MFQSISLGTLGWGRGSEEFQSWAQIFVGATSSSSVLKRESCWGLIHTGVGRTYTKRWGSLNSRLRYLPARCSIIKAGQLIRLCLGDTSRRVSWGLFLRLHNAVNTIPAEAKWIWLVCWYVLCVVLWEDRESLPHIGRGCCWWVLMDYWVVSLRGVRDEDRVVLGA